MKLSPISLSLRPIHWKKENPSTHTRSIKVRAQNGYLIHWLVALLAMHFFLFSLNMMNSIKLLVMVYIYGNAFCFWLNVSCVLVELVLWRIRFSILLVKFLNNLSIYAFISMFFTFELFLLTCNSLVLLEPGSKAYSSML